MVGADLCGCSRLSLHVNTGTDTQVRPYIKTIMPRQPSKTFTDKELEIMSVIWERGEATAKEIQEALPGERHYNSVLTIIRVLERKGHLIHRAEGKAHVYRAKAKPEK